MRSLKPIADEVVNKDTGINHEKLHDFVSKYGIEYTGQGVVFDYSLDKEQTISEYLLETGKEPILSYDSSEKEFNMKVEISKDFEIISKESSLKISEIPEEYERLYPRRLFNEAFLLYGLLIEIPILIVYMVFCFLMMQIETFADTWRKKHGDELS